jgi:hypothetical protein
MRGAGFPIEMLAEYIELVQPGDHTKEVAKADFDKSAEWLVYTRIEVLNTGSSE